MDQKNELYNHTSIIDGITYIVDNINRPTTPDQPTNKTMPDTPKKKPRVVNSN